jgi:hypothetical protein
MALLGRSRRAPLPPEAADALGLGPKDRVLAWSPLAGGGVAACTPEGLRIMTVRGRLIVRPWTDVHHAAWEAESGALAIWWVGTRQSTPLEIEDASRLPDVVHQRVTASVVLATEVVVPGGRRVWVALRKGQDGALTTQAVPPPGVSLDDPQVAPVIARAFRALRDEAGI